MSSLFGSQKTGEGVAELLLETPQGWECLARLESSDVAGRGTQFQTIRDPKWIISCSGTPQEWLHYRALDGRLWWVKVRAEFDPYTNAIDFSFEHRGPAETEDLQPGQLSEDCSPSERHRIGFFGADHQTRYRAIIRSAGPCQTPSFLVERIEQGK